MSDDRSEYSERGDAVLAVFRRGAEFTRELIAENERLRAELSRVRERQHHAAQDPQDWDKLLARISDLEQEKESIAARLRSLENENHQFAERYVEIEEENNNLANLYVASYQLHSTLDPSEVIKIILEIVINLIGAETFCVYLHSQRDGTLEPVACEGAPLSHFPRVRLGQGSVGGSLERGTVHTLDPRRAAAPGEGGEPIVAIPLGVDERPIGAIAVYQLLQQKDGFSPLDQELFTLLAGHAATAIFASQLFSQSERKLHTIQGFIDLLTK